MNTSVVNATLPPLPLAVATVLVTPLAARSASSRAQTLQLFMMLGYAVMCLLCIALIVYLRRHRLDARKGNSSAARRVILPAFEPLLWILCLTTGAFTTTLVLILALDIFRNGTPKIASECFYCGRQFVFLLIMVFMHQKSVSIPALKRCVLVSLVLATYTLPFVIYTVYWGDPSKADLYYIIQRALRFLLIVWYVYIFARPPSRASKKSIRQFCGFTFVYQALTFTSNELSRSRHKGTGYAFAYAALLWAALTPLVIWRVLRADTEHWRGMGQRACMLQSVFRQKNQIHEHISSQGFHVLIEMHRKLIIDFAYLELRQKIGIGASAVVFNGVLHSRIPVATKVYTPTVLSDEVVASFSHEAALCGALNHPNIVLFYGMCVYPPTVCLVFELCQGSLEDVLRANQRREFHPNRQQLSINVGYMIDAARAVAYLHSFSPGFLHRDIKPANFLVDAEFNVKLTDFGESRTLTTRTPSGVKKEVEDSQEDFHAVTMPSPTVLEMQKAAEKMTVKGTVDYMAPELINGKGGFASYGEAADVYSLAMTMWDILHPGQERYPGCSSSHLHVFQAVLDGKRPKLSPDLHPTLREIINSAWHVNPRMRPSAQIIVSTLEAVQEEVSAAFLTECFEDVGSDTIAVMAASDDDELTKSLSSDSAPGSLTGGAAAGLSVNGQAGGGTFSGAEAVDQLRSNKYVNSTGEALRLGRMWLDAGFMHHVKHSRGFTNDDARYFLDEDSIRMCQPLPGDQDDVRTYKLQDPLRPHSSIGGHTQASCTSDLSASRGPGSETNATTTQGGRSGLCACRKHGQRQVYDVKPSKRQRFRRKKFRTITEENLLTASLLMQEEGSSMPAGTDFSGFEWHCRSNFNSVPE